MAIQDSILAVYTPVIKRIRNWLLPLILLLLLGTAYGKYDPVVLSYFSTIELTSIHFYLGWLLGIIWLILVYDFFFSHLAKEKQTNLDSHFEKRPRPKGSLTGIVNAIFYLLLFLICLSGLAQYSLRFLEWQPFHVHRISINLAHIALGWLFISTALVKYYLSFTRWVISLTRYLMEN